MWILIYNIMYTSDRRLGNPSKWQLHLLCKPTIHIIQKVKKCAGLGNEITIHAHILKVSVQAEGELTWEEYYHTDRVAETPSDLSLLFHIKWASEEWKIPHGDI